MIYCAKPVIICFLTSLAVSTAVIQLGLERLRKTKVPK
jgi:hypothetical protein